MKSLEPNLNPKTNKPEVAENVLLKDILTHENPNMYKYRLLIEEAERRLSQKKPKPSQAPWDFEWPMLKRKEYEQEVSFLHAKLNGSVLIDLASGRVHKKRMPPFSKGIYDFAKQTQVGLYIGVEWRLDESLIHSPSVDVSEVLQMPSAGEMKHILVQNDVLDFISRIESNAIINGRPVNITINGLDNWVLDYPEYNQALAKEIVRVLPNRGIIFGVKSSVVTSLGSQKELNSLRNSKLLEEDSNEGAHAKGNAEYYDKDEGSVFQQNRRYMIDSDGKPSHLGFFIFEKQAA